MAERWLEDIYDQAHIIQELHEIVWFLHTTNAREARALYNCVASRLEKMLVNIAQTDVAMANYIQDSAIEVTNAWDDPYGASGKIMSALIPSLFKYMQCYTDICVEDNGYLLKSADSGYLTIKDLNSGLYLHDTHDPMYEAYQLSQVIYTSDMETFRIFGAGLGYLPYMIWSKSDRAIKICIYEEDSNIIEYADHFGVSSLIESKSLEIITDESLAKLAERFLNDIRNDKHPNGRYVSPWKARKYSGVYEGLITRLNLTDNSNRMLRHMSTINLWKNRKLKNTSFRDFKKKFQGNEWIIVAAGPSFDDNLDFIKSNADSKNIVAVNTVLKRLEKENIKPSISVAADPYEQILEHIDGILPYTANIPLIADRLTYWGFSEAYLGEKCFVPTAACRFIKGAVSSEEFVWEVGGTVASLAIEVAIQMGAKIIHLIGLDLAYPNGINYAEGMPHARITNSNITITVPSVDGKTVGTNEIFDIFRKTIEEHQIAPHNDIQFINRSSHGAKIAGTHSLYENI